MLTSTCHMIYFDCILIAREYSKLTKMSTSVVWYYLVLFIYVTLRAVLNGHICFNVDDVRWKSLIAFKLGKGGRYLMSLWDNFISGHWMTQNSTKLPVLTIYTVLIYQMYWNINNGNITYIIHVGYRTRESGLEDVHIKRTWFGIELTSRKGILPFRCFLFYFNTVVFTP